MTTTIKFLTGGLAALVVWAASVSPAISKPYKGAEVFTYDSMLYGKFVIRMKAAKGSGVISNMFLWKDGSELPGIFWEEVDIEVFGKDNATSWQSNIITGIDSRIYSEGVHEQSTSFGDEYHTFAIEWTPDQVVWTVNGEVIRTAQGGSASDLRNPAQMRINFWNPNITEWVGEWNANVLPLYMYVNWVEYHSWTGNGFRLEWRDDFDHFDTGRWGTADWTFEENRSDFSPQNVVVRDGYLVLALTREGQEGYQGNPPQDNPNGAISSSSSSTAVSSASSSSSSSSVSSSVVSSSSAASSAAVSSSSVSSVASSANSSTGGGTGNTAGGALNFSALLAVLFLGLLNIARSKLSTRRGDLI